MQSAVLSCMVVWGCFVCCGATVAADDSAAKRIEQLGGKATFGSDGKTITRIYLGRTPASDADLAWVGTLGELIELSLANTRITDAGLPSLSGLRKLEALHLADNPITSKGVESLKGLVGDPHDVRLQTVHHLHHNAPLLGMRIFAGEHVGHQHALRIQHDQCVYARA